MAPHVVVEDVSVASISAAKVAWRTTDLRAKLGVASGGVVFTTIQKFFPPSFPSSSPPSFPSSFPTTR